LKGGGGAMKSEKEIREILEAWIPWGEKKNISPWANYQDGILDALDWVLGELPKEKLLPKVNEE
jgi:hypothetical protein